MKMSNELGMIAPKAEGRMSDLSSSPGSDFSWVFIIGIIESTL